MTELTQWLLSHGISMAVLEILVFVPILATLVNLSRYFIGFKSFGIYAPIILGLSYRYTGLRYGLIITLLVVLSSLIGYSIMRRIRMHYLARVAINYLIVAIILLFGIAGLDSLEILGFTNFESINPLALISIAALSDFFIKMYVKKSIAATVRVLLETVLISVIGWVLISSETIIGFMLSNLWMLGAILLFNLLIGRYTGLRIKEYFRFSFVVKNDNK
ncbi:hypothetical protein HYV12_01180 [Candidatus Dojkabacteria bacterium]|nr:hypothetical protein [Candidatus Dojkabacteria bacterium]